MANHNIETEEKNYDYLYYLIALITGIITAALFQGTFVYIIVGSVVGLLGAAFFIKYLLPRK